MRKNIKAKIVPLNSTPETLFWEFWEYWEEKTVRQEGIKQETE